MNSDAITRKIQGATVQDVDLDNKGHQSKDVFQFCSCPEALKSFIEDTDLHDLIYWKLMSQYEKLESSSSNEILKTVLNQVEYPLFVFVLKKTRGNQSKAAEILGCNRNTLHRKLKDFSVEPRNLRKALKNAEPKNSKKNSLNKNLEL